MAQCVSQGKMGNGLRSWMSGDWPLSHSVSNQQLQLTGAAIMVFTDKMFSKRPWQLNWGVRPHARLR
jgi:hypothetical protein